MSPSDSFSLNNVVDDHEQTLVNNSTTHSVTRRKLAHYRDFTLGILAGMCLLYGYGFASEAFSMRGSPPDGWIALGAFAGMALCIILSPNRMLIVVSSFATVSGLTILKLFSAPSMKSFVTAAVPLSITILLCLVAAFKESYRRS